MKKVRVRMLKDHRVSVDGITEILLRKGECHEFNPDSAGQLIDRQYCIEDRMLAGLKRRKKLRQRRKKRQQQRNRFYFEREVRYAVKIKDRSNGRACYY